MPRFNGKPHKASKVRQRGSKHPNDRSDYWSRVYEKKGPRKPILPPLIES